MTERIAENKDLLPSKGRAYVEQLRIVGRAVSGDFRGVVKWPVNKMAGNPPVVVSTSIEAVTAEAFIVDKGTPNQEVVTLFRTPRVDIAGCK